MYKIELQFLQGPLQGQCLSFTEYTKVSIGRSTEAYIPLSEDKKLSRFHCLLEILPPSNCLLKDLNSKNGTFVGRLSTKQVSFQQITEVYLGNGDYVKVGDTVFRVILTIPAAQEEILCSKCRAPIRSEQYGRGEARVCEGKPLCGRCQKEDRMLPEGKTIGNFEIMRKLGEGGMGIVYLVKHTRSQHLFAIKIARPNVPPTEAQIKRFLREASLGETLRHEHLIRYYPPGYAPGGFFYIPMEYVPGTDFSSYLKKLGRPLTLAEAEQPVLQFLDALSCLHTHNIVHRDLKPSNLLVMQKENGLHVKLSDFGLAKNYEESGFSGITLSNQILGTMEYLAPEQMENARRVDPRADIYSAGATIYFLLTCRTIYNEASMAHMITKIFVEEPVPIWEANPSVPQEMGNILMQCLKKNPGERIQTAQELRQALEKSFQAQRNSG